jgi:cation diffusion facilitator family transporter
METDNLKQQSVEQTKVEKKAEDERVKKSRALLKKVLIRLLITFTIRLLVFSGELTAGLVASSLAIVADALEKLSDMVYLSVSIFSVWVSSRPANEKYSFGFYRAGVLGALLSAAIMWIIAGILVYSAISRIMNLDSEEVNGEIMLITSLIGMVINILVMFMLRAKEEEKKSIAADQVPPTSPPTQATKKEDIKKNENLRAVIFDILGDMVMSVITIITSIIVWVAPSAKLADPICTLFFPVICFFVTRPIIKDCFRVLMQATPSDIEIKGLKDALKKISGVSDVHDFHIWSLASGKLQISCHMRVKGDNKQVLSESISLCESYGVDHSTIQIEEGYADEDLHIGHAH